MRGNKKLTNEDKFRLEKQIQKKLMMCIRSSEAFNYLGHLQFTHRKIDSAGYEKWFKWWKKHKQKIVRPPKDPGEQSLNNMSAMEGQETPEEKKQREAEEKRERDLAIKDIPF